MNPPSIAGPFALVTPERHPLTIFNWRNPKPPATGWVPTFSTLAKAEAFLRSIPFSNLPARRDLIVAIITEKDLQDAPPWMKFTLDPPPLPPLPKWVN